MPRLMSLTLALALFVPAVHAEDKDKDVKKSNRPVEELNAKNNPLDKKFLIAAYQCCNNSDNLLSIVGNFASSEKVKEFAKKAKKEHDELQDEVGKVVKNTKIAIVATPDRESINEVNELRKKEKGEFDKAFLNQFIEKTEKGIKMAEHQKANGKDKEITKLAEKMLPVLRDHAKKAKELKKDLK